MILPKAKTEKSLFTLFEQIENTPGTNDKLALLKSANEQQQKLLEICYNPYRQYHVKKWDDRDFEAKFSNDRESFVAFKELIGTLESNNSNDYIRLKTTAFMGTCTELQKKFYTRIIKKDLKIGLNVVSINKVFYNLIPKFDLMLAKKHGSGTIAHFPTTLMHWLYQAKLDGFRNVLYCLDGVGVTRSGKELPNKYLKKKLAPYRGLDYVLDGEFYSHEISFGEISSILRSKDKPIPDHLHFMVWDMIPTDIWKIQGKTISYEKRIRQLKQLERDFPDDFIKVIESTYIQNVVTGEFIDFITKESTDIFALRALYLASRDAGYEGLMAKDPDMPYEWKRSSYMYKIKQEDNIDGIIIDVYEGTGKYEDMLGGITVQFEEDIVNVDVGGGFSDVQRQKFWDDPPIDRWCEIKYTEITENKSGTHSLRHPRFVRLREDKR